MLDVTFYDVYCHTCNREIGRAYGAGETIDAAWHDVTDADQPHVLHDLTYDDWDAR